MQFRIEHTTTFTYDAPIVEATTELRLRPMDGRGQRCTAFRLLTDPRGVRIHQFTDHLGNTVGHFDVLEPHDRLTVTATSEVSTGPFDDREPPSPLELFDYLHPTEYAHLEKPLATTSPDAPAAGRARELMDVVADSLQYEQGATSVQTSAPEVLALGRGVCQDFAHVLIAACRLDGIPARYVSGYLPGEGATHAWVDAWDDACGWVALDPTHRREQSEEYVRIAHGRDYADVPPTRGIFKGVAEETLDVHVVVRPV